MTTIHDELANLTEEAYQVYITGRLMGETRAEALAGAIEYHKLLVGEE
jgi:hypothetical protein